MHIGFRTSGGRGEYEVVGSHSGFAAADLENWSFFMLWPDGLARDTGLWLDPGGSGKPRLRSVWKRPIQIGRIIAPMLLMPDPTRSFKDTPSTGPIVRAKKYSVTQVGFSPESDLAPLANRVTFKPSWIEVASQGGSDAIGVKNRWERIQSVYANVHKLPVSVANLVSEHQNFLAAGKDINNSLISIVSGICENLSKMSNGDYVSDHDPLEYLEYLTGAPSRTSPSLPPPDELSEDEIEISARSAFEYRLSKIRGSSGRRFSTDVRAAYNGRCAFCGVQLSGLEGIPAGIDAAHILAWSKHELDTVSNGIALCKLHHWAFDASIMMPVILGDKYYVRFTTMADKLDNHTLSRLGIDGMQIRDEWLPVDPKQKPSKKYLRRLYADLGIVFKVDIC